MKLESECFRPMFLHTQIAPVEGVKLTRGTEVLPVAFYLNQMLNWKRQAYVYAKFHYNSHIFTPDRTHVWRSARGTGSV